LGIKLIINNSISIEDDDGIVVVAYVDDSVKAMTGSILTHERQVSKVFQLLMDNKMCVEIDKCVFTIKEVAFLGFIVGGNGI
jgi:hypothetical protein